MQIARISLFDKICIAGWQGGGSMQVAKKLLIICIAGSPGGNANCKNIYDEIIAKELLCKLQKYLYLTKYALLGSQGPM